MRQFNHWKLDKLKGLSAKLVLWVNGLALLLLNTVFHRSIDFDMVSRVISIASIILGALLYSLERYLWKTNIMNLPFLDAYWTPVLEGRWEGTLTRAGERIPFVIEIRQSFNSISCITYSRNSSSSSIAAELLYNEQLKAYEFVYYWQAKTDHTQENTGDTNIFHGYTVLTVVIKSQKVAKLKGSYFTDRQPRQTKGTLEMTVRRETLKNSF